MSTPADDHSLLEGMRRWAGKYSERCPMPRLKGRPLRLPGWEEPAAVAESADAGLGDLTPPPTASSASAWIEETPVASTDMPEMQFPGVAANAPPPVATRKPGFFRRMFGRKGPDVEANPSSTGNVADSPSAWLPSDEQDQEHTQGTGGSDTVAPEEPSTGWVIPDGRETPDSAAGWEPPASVEKPASTWLAAEDPASPPAPPVSSCSRNWRHRSWGGATRVRLARDQ